MRSSNPAMTGKIFEKARQTSPTIIFFDEIDALAGSRQSQEMTSNNSSKGILSQFLTELDGLEYLQNVFVIAATNRPDLIDSAILRPGRIEKLLYIKPPNVSERKEIFSIHTKNMPLDKQINLDVYAQQTENYTGAEIFSICREAGWIALRENKDVESIKKAHFEKGLGKIGPSITREIIQFYENFEKAHTNKSLLRALSSKDTFYDFQ